MGKSSSKKRTSAKKTKIILIFLLFVVLVAICFAVFLALKSPTYVSLNFNYDGAETQKVQVVFGEQVILPQNVVRDGYTFDGWYTDKACTQKAELNFLSLFFDQTLYAKWTPTSDSGETPQLDSGELSVHFLELGNKYTGDCVFIKAGDNDILIDAGSKNNSGETICNYVSQYCTDGVLEYVIATHAHEDHISGFYGANGVFANFKTETIIEFALTNKENPSASTVVGKYYAARNNEVQEGAKCYTAAQCFNQTDGAQREYQLTDTISLEILYNPYYFKTQSSGENDYSVCVMIHQGENNYLFTGDLEEGGEKAMVEYYQNQNDPLPHCVLYKAGHHGSKTSSCEELMAAITPEYVCVCCCCGTSEYTDTTANQFPTQQFINNVAPYTDKVYVTTMVDNYVSKNEWSGSGTVKSMNGNIVFTCRNGEITMQFSNSELKLKDTDWFKANRTCPNEWSDEQ